MSRRALIPVVALAVLVTLLMVATLQLIGTKRVLVAGLTTVTGREVYVEGSTKLRAGLVPGLVIEGLTMGPAEGSALRSARIGRVDLERRGGRLASHGKFADATGHRSQIAW